MNLSLVLAFLFFIGSMLGWGIEVVFRRFFSSANPEHKWINPGFLTGPYLPLYGFGLTFLYLISLLESLPLFQNGTVSKLILFALMAVCMTLIEYIAGIIFIKGMKIKLWDYSGMWGNIQGIICPLFSLFWAILGALYYFLVHPYIREALAWLSCNLAFSFVIGFFYGVFVLDVVKSTSLLVRLRRFADEQQIIIRYEDLKEEVRRRAVSNGVRARFFFDLRGRLGDDERMAELADRTRHFADRLRAGREELREAGSKALEDAKSRAADAARQSGKAGGAKRRTAGRRK